MKNTNDIEALKKRESELEDTVKRLSELVCKQGEVLAIHDEALRLCSKSLKNLTERVSVLEQFLDKNDIDYPVNNYNYEGQIRLFHK